MEATQQLHSFSVTAPVTLGQEIAADILNTGVSVIATRSLPRKINEEKKR